MISWLFDKIRESVKVYNNQVNEASINDLKRKQRTISWLFPTFHDRVVSIGNMGGVRLVNMDDDNWDFKVHSGTKKDVWYDCVIHFVNVNDTIKKLVMDRRLWTINKDKVDLRKLATEFSENVSVKIVCSCPADLYYGGHYIRSLPRYDAKYTNPERRIPRIRNPRMYGSYCKHLSAVIKAFPFYNNTIAKWLNQFYGKEIEEYSELARKEFGIIKSGAEELSKRLKIDGKSKDDIKKPVTGIRYGKTHLDDSDLI